MSGSSLLGIIGFSKGADGFIELPVMATDHPWKSGWLGEKIWLRVPSVGGSLSRGDPPPGDSVSPWAGSVALERELSGVDSESPDSEACVPDDGGEPIRLATARP